MTTSQTTPELLACPFCSGTDLTTEQPGLDHTRCIVKCHTCGGKGPPSAIEQRADLVAFTAVPDARTRWNTRAATQERAAPLEGASEKTLDEVMKQRDDYHDVADDLAAQIAAITQEDIGEHSSSNNPWQNALNAANYWLTSPVGTPPRQPLAPPPGWKLVPIEPTEQMIGTVASEYLADHGYDDAWVAHAYKSMVAAAPQPPVSALPLAVGVEPDSLADEREFLKGLIAEVHRDQLPTNRLQNIAARVELRLRKLP